jgi:Zn-dependent metalloprotease
MLATRSLVASTVLAAAAALTLSPFGSAAADDPKPKAPSSSHDDQARPPQPTRDERAKAAAEAVIAARAPQLHLSRYDRTIARPTLRSDHLRFVPYERTYRGLSVVGGDFVVVVDGGDVVFTSVAQTGKVNLPDITPSVASATARTRTAEKVNGARLGRSQLVVLQRGDHSDLAWLTTATGRRAGQPSRLDVYVDADTGQVLKTDENVQYGDGDGNWSGPSPLSINTTHVGSQFFMTTPGTSPALTCQDTTNTTFAGPDDLWGNGNGTSTETGCVDALYGAQQLKLMLTGWLGRNGMNGMGGWLPIRVGLDDQNAYYDGTQVQIGHNPAGEWVGSVDIIAHELGHGVDNHTPGGLSGGNTSEFVADVFGTATEYYDNQPAPYDVRDFLIGEEVDLSGSGEIRNMVNPSLEGDPNCYSPTVGDPNATEVHAAAGPGDHWYYLAAIGSNKAGEPVSPTCNSTTVTGVGVTKATKIMYTAMLMKTSASSYPNYRKWTLLATRYLYGQSSCAEFNRVKAAWNAVSVPAQVGEGTCTAGQPAVSITNATQRTVTAGAAITPFTLTATGGASPYTWAATGLPVGLTINSGSGQVAGTPAADKTGSYTVGVTATDDVGRVGKAWFTLAVNPATANTCTGQRVGNSGFENQTHAPWTMPLWAFHTDAALAYTGQRHAWLGGYGETATETMAQEKIKVPTGCKATLTFWVWSLTQESTVTTVFDTLTVKAGATTVFTQSNLDAVKTSSCGGPCPKTYVRRTVVLPAAFSGKTFTLSFISAEDSSLYTNFHLDNIQLTVSPP